mgnify:CR=1 FL=1
MIIYAICFAETKAEALHHFIDKGESIFLSILPFLLKAGATSQEAAASSGDNGDSRQFLLAILVTYMQSSAL